MDISVNVTIQMMHGSEWTLKYDEPEVENVGGYHISVWHERQCFMFCRIANH